MAALGVFLLFWTPTPGAAENLPDYRPALMGSRHSLINLIDTNGLMKKGQKDAVIFFSAQVGSNGRGDDILVYRGTPGSELLGKELLRRNSLAFYEPAIYDHQLVPVVIYGTVVFVVRDGQPHLRIFLNQEPADLRKPSDFVAPQLTRIHHLASAQSGLPNPSPTPAWHTPGVALLSVDVDLKGEVEKAAVAYEYPTGKNLGSWAAAWAKYDTFIPGFRNGKAVACRFTLPVLFNNGHRVMTLK